MAQILNYLLEPILVYLPVAESTDVYVLHTTN